MADIQSNIKVNIDTSEALASIKLLQRQISAFHTSMAKSGAASAAASANLQQNLVNSLNATGKFTAEMRTIKTSTEAFTTALEKNKLTMREYYRYAGASTKTFGRLFASEFDTINKVARERVKDLQTQYIKMGRDANGAMKAIAVRPLALDMQNLGTQTAIAAQRQQLLNQLLKQGSTNLLNFGKNTQWAGRQLMVGFTIPLMYFGTAAAKTFMQIEEQAIRFKRVYGEIFTTSAETDKALKDIELLAQKFTKYGVAVADTMKMAADAAAQGKMGADLMAQVGEATRLAVLGGVDQQQALQTTISLTNAFGISADQLGKKVNFLNAVENQTVVSIEDLTTAIPKAGPVVKQLGGNVEDLAFFLTAMKEGGIDAAQGANALKSGLASLINPSKKASDMLAGFGINIQGIVEANKGNIKGIVIGFAQALNTLDPLNRSRAIEQLFGKFQFARLSTLFQNVIQQGSQASRVLKLTQATTEELAILSERELKRIEDSPMYKFKKTIEDLKVTLAPVGAAFLKAVTPIVEFIGKVLDKFNNLSDGAKNFVVIFTTIFAGIGPVALMTFGLLANGIANIIKLFTAVKGVFNRAGAGTQDLASQTTYMTKAQIEAASVAASLDQVHNKLTQSFTSETTAINLLVQAYERAVAAQSAFLPGKGGFVPGKGPRKFNTGTTNVRYYAQGTDTVPAMLTPGEAIIPAGPAQNPINKPYIKHMVAGGIIGQYSTGTLSVAGRQINFGNSSYLARTQASAIGVENLIIETQRLRSVIGNIDDLILQALNEATTTIGSKGKVSAAALRQTLKTIGNGAIPLAKTTAAYQGGFFGNAGVVAAHGTPGIVLSSSQANKLGSQLAPGAVANQLMKTTGNVRMLSNLTFPMPASFNKGIMTGAEGAKWIGQNRTRFTSMIAQQHGLNPNDPGFLQFGKVVGQALKRIGNVVVTESQFEKIIENGLKEDLTIAAKNALLTSKNTFATAQIGGFSGRAGHGGIQRVNLPANAQGQTFAGLNLGGKSYRTQSIAGYNTGADNFVKKIVVNRLKDINAAIEQGVKQELQVASPSKRMRKIGQQSGEGLVQGAQSTIKDAKAAGTQIGYQITDSATLAAQKAFREKTASMLAIGGVPTSTIRANQQKFNALSKEEQDRLIAQRLGQSQAQQLKNSKMSLYGPGPVDATQKSLRRQMEKQQKLSQLAMKNAYKESQIPLIAGGNSGRGSSNNNGSGGGFFGRFRKTPGEDGTPRQGMGASGGMMAASGILMAASMAPGKVGDIAQKLMMPVMALTMLLPLLSNPLGAAIVAITALVAVAVKLRMAFDSAQNSAMKLSETLGSGNKAIGDLSKFAGTVSANDIMKRRRQDAFSTYEVQAGKTTFGQSFVQEAQGKAMLSGLSQTIKTGGKNAAIDNLVNQLSTSVISGVISPDQARSIAANLSQQLGDYGFGIQVSAKLTELLGVNGENLIKDPLTLRVKLVQDNRSKATSIINDAAKAGSFFSLLDDKKTYAKKGYFEKLFGNLKLPFSAPFTRNEKLGTASGAAVAMQKITLEQQQQMIDSLDLEYQKKIDIAKASGDQKTVDDLINKNLIERQRLLDENAITVNKIQTDFEKTKGATRDALMTGVDKAITEKYKGTAMADVASLAKDKIGLSGLAQGKQYTLKMQLATGNIDPMQMMQILTMFQNDNKSIDKIMNIITKFGGPVANDALTVAGLFVDQNGKPIQKQQAKFIADVSAKTSDEANKYLSLFTQIGKVGKSELVDVGVALTYYNNNPEAAKNLMGTINQIKELKGKIKFEIAAKYVGAKGLEVLKQDSQYFESLPAEQQKTYLLALNTIANIQGNNKDAIQAWLKKNPGKTEIDYYKNAVNQITATSTDTTATPTPTPSSSSTQIQASPLDNLLKKLRDVRKLQIQVTEGWVASMNALNNLFGNGKVIKDFNGLEQSMRRLGAGENLIDLITGMDPKEYEKRKNQLFKFDNKGNILQLKQDALSIQEALNSIVMGDFQTNIEKQRVELVNQNAAFTKLSQLGVPVANAYELISDKTLAATIATAKNETALKKMIAQYKQFIIEQKKAQAIQGVNTDISQFTSDYIQNQRIKQNYSFADAFAINSDANLKLLEQQVSDAQQKVNQRIKAGADKEMIVGAQAELDKLVAEFNDRLAQLKSTIDYMQGVFDNGFNKAMEWFNAQEKSIQLDFQLGTNVSGKNTISDALQQLYKGTPVFTGPDGKPILKFNLEADTKNIAQYENQISLLQYQIDDWQYSLKEIEDKEKQINDTYDVKVKALEQIQKINSRITAQQKSQLTLADALSQGDIAAAARAAQDMRSQAAQNALDDQRTALDKGKENALANVRNSQGFTRIQIEDKIKTLQDQISTIEQNQLQPAKERLRIAEQLQIDAIQALTILGKTKTQWEQVQNSIDLAKTSSAEYAAAMQAALDIVGDIIKYWNNVPSKKTTEYTIITTYVPAENPGGGGGAGGGSGGGAGGGTGGGAGNAGGGSSAGGSSGGSSGVVSSSGGTNNVPNDIAGTTGTAPYGRINGIVAPSGDIPSVVYNHLYDLGNIANGMATASADFAAIVESSKIADEAGMVAAGHYMDLYNLGKTVADYNANKVTDLQQSLDAAASNASQSVDVLTNAQKSAVTKASSSGGITAASHLADLYAASNNASSKAIATATKNAKISGTTSSVVANFLSEHKANGGLITKRYAIGGNVSGTDTVPAMLSPGEFIVRKYAVNDFGLNNLKAINNGTYQSGSVYNYDLTVNVKSDSDPSQIADVVMNRIRQVESMRVKGNRL